MMKRFLYLTVVIFILGFGFGRPAAARAQLPASQLPADAFSGRVYEGATGVEPPASRPIEGVTVSLYCSQNQNELGVASLGIVTIAWLYRPMRRVEADLCPTSSSRRSHRWLRLCNPSFGRQP